jgi:hypothetical protein
MTEIVFGTLMDLQPRDAWPSEARDFTPWLAANIAHLAHAIGIPLEITGTEVTVERFAADILARNPMDDTVVLIENQLEMTDHTHLGQIMTYLAGLNAHTVVWIAPGFREPHLSAIRWLNEHTAEGFSFFAVKLRLVRIADSPFAPIFEVVEKPNDWERRLVASRKEAESVSDIGERRRAFWQAYLNRVPEAAAWGLRPVATSSVWVPVTGLVTDAYLSLWIGATDCGAFMRGSRGSDAKLLIDQLDPVGTQLEAELGAIFRGSSTQHFLWSRASKGFGNPDNWPDIIDWMERARRAYLAALARNVPREGDQSVIVTE